MRQVGTLENQRLAERFAAWLVTQRIEAHAEEENGGWVVWVREEDQLRQARESLVQFRSNPDDPQYQGVEKSAQSVKQSEEARRRQAQKNVVEVRGRWGTAGGMPVTARRAPLVMALIGLSALTAIATWDDTMQERKDPEKTAFGPIFRALLFVDPAVVLQQQEGQLDMSVSVRAGQVWRLITPIFIHFGYPHIILNMIWLYSFGSAVEDRRGSRFMLMLVLALAISSNVGQAIEANIRERGVLFGGMSGVGFGLFGYLAVKARFDSRERYYLNPGTTFMALLWFALCILRDIPPFSAMLEGAIPPIANTAHAVGLAVGAAIAYVPLLVRKPA